jgi:hypothetical protein
VNQQIGPLRVSDQILIDSSVARQHSDAAFVVDAVPIRWQFLAAMVDLERGDFDSFIVKDNTFADLVRDKSYALRRIVYSRTRISTANACGK